MKKAVRRGRWEEVASLLKDSNYSSSSVEQFVTACELYRVIHVDSEILSHCSSEQKDRLLKIAVWKKRWVKVASLLKDSNYSSSSVEQFITTCEHYGVIHVDSEILSHCSSGQKDRLLKIAVKLCRGNEDRWSTVKILLQDNNYSSGSVEQFVTACEQNSVIYVDYEILSHCSSEQKDRLVKIAVQSWISAEWPYDLRKWSTVVALLRNCNYSSGSVELIVTACEQYEVIRVDSEILSHCSSEQKDRLLKIAVWRKRWEEVASLLKDSNYSSSSVEQFVTACEVYRVIHVDSEILSHCSSEQKDRFVKLAVKLLRGEDRWNTVKILLQDTNYSSSSVEQFITACERYDIIHVDSEILSHCTPEQKDRLLKTAVKSCRWDVNGNRWSTVTILLQDNNYSTSSVEMCVTACELYRVIYVESEILSHCSTQQLGRMLTLVAELEKWSIVGELLKAGGSLEKRVLSHYNTQQLDCLLTEFATKGEWETVGKVMKVGGSHEKKVWVIEKVCDSFSDFERHILPHINDEKVCDSVSDFERHILPHINDDLLSQCTTELLDRLLTTVTRFRRWEIIDRLLRAGGSQGKRVWVIELACLTADHSNFQRCISPHCDGQLHKQIVNNPQIGLTLLFSAVLNQHSPQRMVAECIRLGFSTHQPPAVLATPARVANSFRSIVSNYYRDSSVSGIFASPFLRAVLRGLLVVAHMLYESGSCSYSELQHLYTLLLDLSDPHTEDGRKLIEELEETDWQRPFSFRLHSELYKWFKNTVTTFLPYLREMGSTPRSLVSSCRLVISHCLTVGGGRERAVQELPLTDRMKSYLLFSDLTDPDYQPRLYGTKSAALPQQK